PAGVVHAESASGTDTGADHGAGLELRLRADVESPRGVHQLPAPKDGGRWRTAVDPHRARSRLRPPGAVSLRTRLTVAGGGAVFVALAIASLVIYFDVRSKLHDQIDFSLIQSAENVAVKWHGANGVVTFPSARTGSTGKRLAGTVPAPRKPKSPNAPLLFDKD